MGGFIIFDMSICSTPFSPVEESWKKSILKNPIEMSVIMLISPESIVFFCLKQLDENGDCL